ncbi:hypothetical protein BV25DRAFT_1902780, partial [Artomyces pyxidatus]
MTQSMTFLTYPGGINHFFSDLHLAFPRWLRLVALVPLIYGSTQGISYDELCTSIIGMLSGASILEGVLGVSVERVNAAVGGMLVEESFFTATGFEMQAEPRCASTRWTYEPLLDHDTSRIAFAFHILQHISTRPGTPLSRLLCELSLPQSPYASSSGTPRVPSGTSVDLLPSLAIKSTPDPKPHPPRSPPITTTSPASTVKVPISSLLRTPSPTRNVLDRGHVLRSPASPGYAYHSNAGADDRVDFSVDYFMSGFSPKLALCSPPSICHPRLATLSTISQSGRNSSTPSSVDAISPSPNSQIRSQAPSPSSHQFFVASYGSPQSPLHIDVPWHSFPLESTPSRACKPFTSSILGPDTPVDRQHSLHIPDPLFLPSPSASRAFTPQVAADVVPPGLSPIPYTIRDMPEKDEHDEPPLGISPGQRGSPLVTSRSSPVAQPLGPSRAGNLSARTTCDLLGSIIEPSELRSHLHEEEQPSSISSVLQASAISLLPNASVPCSTPCDTEQSSISKTDPSHDRSNIVDQKIFAEAILSEAKDHPPPCPPRNRNGKKAARVDRKRLCGRKSRLVLSESDSSLSGTSDSPNESNGSSDVPLADVVKGRARKPPAKKARQGNMASGAIGRKPSEPPQCGTKRNVTTITGPVPPQIATVTTFSAGSSEANTSQPLPPRPALVVYSVSRRMSPNAHSTPIQTQIVRVSYGEGVHTPKKGAVSSRPAKAATRPPASSSAKPVKVSESATKKPSAQVYSPKTMKAKRIARALKRAAACPEPKPQAAAVQERPAAPSTPAPRTFGDMPWDFGVGPAAVKRDPDEARNA